MEVLIHDGPVIEAEGNGRVRAVIIETPSGRERVTCDTLGALARVGAARRAARMGTDQEVAGAGEVVIPGCSLEEAEASGRRAANGQGEASSDVPTVPVVGDGYVCLCEDVSLHDLEQAWDEGWRSSEILKRYTTATMGPCQGPCAGGSWPRSRARGRTRSPPRARAPRRVRPRARSPGGSGRRGRRVDRAADLAHDRHLELGARMERSGSWSRPTTFGDIERGDPARSATGPGCSMSAPWEVPGRRARCRGAAGSVFPVRVRDPAPGRSRYLVALDEAGYAIDDGLLAALGRGRFYLCSTSGGAPAMEAWLATGSTAGTSTSICSIRPRQLGAILLAGLDARTILERLTDDDVSTEALPHMRHADVTVAGRALPCAPGRLRRRGRFRVPPRPLARSRAHDALLEAAA